MQSSEGLGAGPDDLAAREVQILELVPAQARRKALSAAVREIDAGVRAENRDALDLHLHGAATRPAPEHDLVRPDEPLAQADGVADEAQNEL
jgi:hypothetical protein